MHAASCWQTISYKVDNFKCFIERFEEKHWGVEIQEGVNS